MPHHIGSVIQAKGVCAVYYIDILFSFPAYMYIFFDFPFFRQTEFIVFISFNSNTEFAVCNESM